MGVPRLTALLRPYATSIEWKRQDGRSSTAAGAIVPGLIIDGPALAYFIYHQCVCSEPFSANALEALPSYARLAEAVVVWLNEFEDFGVRVKHIYFDGKLPASKRDVRLERLGKSLDQVRKFRILHPEVAPQRPATRASAREFQTSSGQTRALPASPFLVPAVLEALLASKYGDVTEVVPCEADLKCADPEISTSDDYTLTGDSDLLVHKVPGRVVMFNDLALQLEDKKVLEILYYDPKGIAKRFNVHDLLYVAYFLKEDPHMPLTECISRAQIPGLTSEESTRFWHFSIEYGVRAATMCSTDTESALSRICAELDPRISEMIQDWIQLRRSAQSSEEVTQYMYLSFLIDDPTRASAWRPSTSIRNMAYSILFLGQTVKISEVDRRGLRITETPIVLITSQSELEPVLKQFIDSYTRIESAIGQASDVSRWRAFALFMALALFRDDDTSFPSKQKIERVFLGKQGQHTWSQVHLAAQVEALLYSIRILRQVLETVLADRQSSPRQISDASNEGNTYEALLECLKSLPALSELLTTPGGLLPIGIPEEQLASEMQVFYPTPEDTPAADDDLVETKQRKKRKKTTTMQPAPKTLDKGNMFSVLGE